MSVAQTQAQLSGLPSLADGARTDLSIAFGNWNIYAGSRGTAWTATDGSAGSNSNAVQVTIQRASDVTVQSCPAAGARRQYRHQSSPNQASQFVTPAVWLRQAQLHIAYNLAPFGSLTAQVIRVGRNYRFPVPPHHAWSPRAVLNAVRSRGTIVHAVTQDVTPGFSIQSAPMNQYLARPDNRHISQRPTRRSLCRRGQTGEVSPSINLTRGRLWSPPFFSSGPFPLKTHPHRPGVDSIRKNLAEPRLSC